MFKLKFLGAGLLLASFFGGCGGSTNTGGDSETHFLRACDGDCKGGLTCWCGICTKTCTDNGDCASLNGASSCLSIAGTACDADGPVCDVTCESDSDCRVISDAHRCDATGACRLPAAISSSGNGTSSTSGSGGTTSTSAGGSATTSGAGGASTSSNTSASTAAGGSSTSASTATGSGGSAGAPSTDCCLSATITWTLDGGWAAPPPVYELSGCNTFSQESPRPEANCSSDLPACELSQRPGRELELTPDDLNALLENADVQQALSAAPVTYGVDARPVDGIVQIVTIDDKEVVIGYPCPEDAPECPAIPPGVQMLKQALDQMVLQQINWGSCEQEALCDTELGVEECDAAIPRWRFNPDTHRCEEFSYGGCAEGLNNFSSSHECQQTCDNDPCSYGTQVQIPSDCGTGTMAAGLCFEGSGAACECACFADGGSLSDCVILEQVPAGATCVPPG